MNTPSRPSKVVSISKFFRVAAFLITLASAAGSVRGATTFTWSPSGTSTNWSGAGNWLNGVVTTGNYAEFGLSGTAGTLLVNDKVTGLSGILFDPGAPAYTISGSSIAITNYIVNNSSNLETISAAIQLGVNTTGTIGGTGAVTLSGSVTFGSNGGAIEMFNAAGLVTFSGPIVLSQATSGRVSNLEGSSNILFSGPIAPAAGASTTQGFNYLGTGTLTLSAANGGGFAGAANANISTISVASGGTFSPGVLGNSTLQISGNYTIGTSGSVTLTVKGGDGVNTTRGTLSLADGTINTLTINSTASGATLLTMSAAGTGTNSVLNMEIGNGASDLITLGNNGKISVGAGGVILNINGIIGFANTGATTQNLTLLYAPGSGVNLSSFTPNYTGNMGGYSTATLSVVSGTALVLTLSNPNATATSAYWTGAQAVGGSSTWATFTGGTANSSNWATDITGATDVHQEPGSITNVYFAASSGSNFNTSLGLNFTIESLNFTGTNATVSIGGTGNTLTINAAGVSGNTAGNGVNVAAGEGPVNISTNVALGNSQTWTVNGASPLTVSGTVSGAGKSLTVAGAGSLVLAGNNTFNGGVIVNSGTLVVGGTGALNGSAPNTVTFGPNSTGALNLNGFSPTVASLSTNLNVGTPVVQNGAASGTATLNINQSGSANYAGTLQNGGAGALGVAMIGSGTQVFSGVSTYTGATTVSNGTVIVNGTLGNTPVTVGAASDNTTAMLGGSGRINGTVTVNSPAGFNRFNMISPSSGNAAAAGSTLTLNNGLVLGSDAVVLFDINNGGANDFINILSGGLTVTSGTADIRVPGTLTISSTYNLIGGTGLSNVNLSQFTLQDLGGNSLTANTNYTLQFTSGTLQLVFASGTAASPFITLTSPVSNTRVMQNTALAVTGTVGNFGGSPLSGTLSSGTGVTLTVGNFGSTSVNLGTNSSTTFSGSVNTGVVTGTQSYGVMVSDGNAIPPSTQVSGKLIVLADRVVTSSTAPSFGVVHAGSTVTGTTLLTSTGADGNFTRVQVGNSSGTDANGIIVTGGTNPIFNGSTSDSRTVTGTLNNLGAITGTISLVTGTEAGIQGTQNPNPVKVVYSAQVFSGKASWSGTGGGTSWGTNGNWGDTTAGDIGGAGAPGLAGNLSIGDTATFTDFTGETGATSVTLDGATPTLAAITFNSTTTKFTISGGSGGSINLQNGAVVTVTGTHALNAVLTGTGGWVLNTLTPTSVLQLGGTNTYSGGVTVGGSGILQVTGTGAFNGAAPNAVLVGNSARLQINGFNVSIGALTGGAGAIVEDASVSSATLTINTAGTGTFNGTIGDGGAGGILSLTKTGAGTEVLTGADTYSGSTTFAGGILNVGSLGAIGSSGTLNFTGGTLQYSAANNTDYSFRFNAGTGQQYNIDTNGQNVTFNTALIGLGNSLTKSGSGVLTLALTSSYTGVTNINGGILVTQDLLPQSSQVKIGGTAVWQPGLTANTTIFPILTGVNSGTVTTGTNITAWATGGFAAKGFKLTITANNGAGLTWGSNNFQTTGGSPLVFGSPTSDNQVELTNAINLNTGDAFQRPITVQGNAATIVGGNANFGITGNSALLSGALTQLTGTANAGASTGLLKQGQGALILSNTTSSFQGIVQVVAGALIAGGNSSGTVGGVFGIGTGPSGTNVVQSSIGMGTGNTGSGDNPAILLGGAFWVDRNILAGNNGTNNFYQVGGATDSTGTFSGLISVVTAGNNTFNITQVATTGTNFLLLSGGITSVTSNSVNFNNVGAVLETGTISGAAGFNVIKSNSGTATFTAQNTYTGSTVVLGGVMKMNGSLAPNSAVFVGGAGSAGTPILQGGIGAANGGVLFSPTFTGGTLSSAVYTPSVTIGNLQGVVTINGTAGGAIAGTLSPGNSVGTMSVGSLVGTAGSIMNFEFNGTANDFIAASGSINLNGVTFNLFQEGTTNAFSQLGTYALFSYGSTASISGLSIINPSGTNVYAFSNDTTDKLITLTITTANNSALSLTPSTVDLGAVLVGGTLGSGTATLTNTGTDGAAAFSTSSTGAVAVSPGLGNLAQGASQDVTISGSGAVGTISGTGVAVGTVSATNISNPSHTGDAGPINVTASIYDRAIVTSSTDGLTIVNTGTGSNGANSLISAAEIQQNNINPSSSITQNFGNWSAATPTPIAAGSTGTVATLNSTGLLNGTYHAATSIKVGNVTNSGGAIAGATQGDVLNNNNYALSATVTGNKSSGVADTYEADILNSYAGYGIGSAAPGTTHTNTGGGGTTVGMIAYGTASNNTTLRMSFDTVPTNTDITRASDILTINGADNGINIVGQSSGDGRLFTDVYVLTLSYDLADLGTAYILQDTSAGWFNAVALNSNTKGGVFNPSNDDATFVDDGGVSAKNETFAQYLLNNGGTPTLGDYGYANGVAWAVLDHTATGDQGLTEFAVVAQAVPEPSTYAMIFGGFGMLAAFRRVRRKRLS